MGKYSISGLFFIATYFFICHCNTDWITPRCKWSVDRTGILLIPLGYLALLISFLTALYDFTKEKIFKNSK